MPTTRSADRTNLAAVVSQSVAGDTIILKAYADPIANPYTLTLKSGVNYVAEDWAEGRVLKGTTGHRGQGLGVRITNTLTTSATDVGLFGVYHDTSGAPSINAFLVQSNNVKLYDSATWHRRNDGGRQIGITVLNNASGFTLVRCRLGATGAAGTQYDHALYLKSPFGFYVADCIVSDGGYYPFHLYPYARNGIIDRTVVWGGVRAITFSGENLKQNGSVGLSTTGGQWSDGFYVSENNVFTGMILASRTGSVIETWTPNASPPRPVRNCAVRDSLVLPGSIIPGSLPGVALSGIRAATQPLNPGFKDPTNGDFTRSGVYDGYGPQELFGLTPPPPPPPPPDPTEDPRIQQYEAQLATIKAKLSTSAISLGEAKDIADAITQTMTQLRTRVVAAGTATAEALATYPS